MDRTRPFRTLAVFLASAVLVAAGCVGGGPSASPDGSAAGPPSASPPDVAPIEPSSPPVVGEVPASIVDAARAMLGGVVGADAAAGAAIVRAEAVTWPDGSLGCPVPGEMYTQALVPGYHLVFEVDGTAYDYRATETGYVRACEAGRSRVP